MSTSSVRPAFGQLNQVAPDASASTPDLIDGPKNQVSGDVTVSGVKYAVSFREYGPSSDDDGHFVALDVPSANADVVRFLSTAINDSAAPPIGQ